MKRVMKKVCLIITAAFVFVQCSRSNKYDPDSLTAVEKDQFMMTIIRYVARAPENVGPTEKFKTEHDEYYQERASLCFLEQFYQSGNTQYFLLTQAAPSLTEKRHATGGKLVLNDDGSVAEYEEVFRTWKMVPDTLKKRSYFLFDRMVNGESLEPFYTVVTGDKYIEFPDERTYYDKSAREWKTKELK
ncbi:MAG TPA: hypothetical protein VK589_07290 [Chryseolinea sp.]|nr:hypothetical protein [Chryseolinea sp.]